jgi:type IV secretion system protein VirB1
VRIASALIRAGHRVDLGLMQINYEVWLRPTGFSLEKAFDARTNVRLGTTILSANYAQLLHRSGPRTDALQRALSVYNSGSESRSSEYAQNVLTGRTSIRLLGRGF